MSTLPIETLIATQSSVRRTLAYLAECYRRGTDAWRPTTLREIRREANIARWVREEVARR